MDHFIDTVATLASRLADGTLTTIAVTLLTAPLAVAIAFAAGLARLSHHPALRVAAIVYVELFRGTSLLVQLFFLFYVLPLVGIRLSAWTTGVGALALNFGAYGSEIVRGAILAVPRGQIEAALVLHMPPASLLRRVLLPQALPAMLPPFGNQLIELLKATSLLSLITISDLAFTGGAVAQTSGRVTAVYLLLLAIYFAVAYSLTLAMRAIEHRYGAARPTVRSP